MLNFAIQTARDAGQILADKFGRALQVSNKGDIDLVTEADLAAERLIVERIRSYHPRHAILAEESGDVAEAGGADAEYKWIIDPLDGTTNYAHGYPIFCVSIALEHMGAVVVGVVYDPTRDELFAAERGEGATLNGRRIRASETDELNRALVCTGFPYDVRERGDFARHFRQLHHARAVRPARRRGGARPRLRRRGTLRRVLRGGTATLGRGRRRAARRRGGRARHTLRRLVIQHLHDPHRRQQRPRPRPDAERAHGLNKAEARP